MNELQHEIHDDIEKAAGSNSSHSNEEAIQTPTITSVDVVEAVRALLIMQPTHSLLSKDCSTLVTALATTLNFYDEEVKANAIAVDNLTEEKASDKELQKVGTQYNMTMNQVVGYMDMCEQLNGQMANTGIIAVPFWFHEQYVEQLKMNEALVTQTDSLLATLDSVEKKAQEEKGTIAELGLDMPKRTNIITGVTTPYIAGVTGARLGDEYLDKDHIYIPKLGKR